MNILFISYAEVSLRSGNARPVAMLRALADAGHRVDLLAPRIDMPAHRNIRLLLGGQGRKPGWIRLRMACLHAALHGSYGAIHAVDHAVFLAYRLCRWKKVPLVYDAGRRFSGSATVGAGGLLGRFPAHFQRLEAKVLAKATRIFSPCSALTADLLGVDRHAPVVQLEDIPIQPLCVRQEVDRSPLLGQFGKCPASIIVCSTLPGNAPGFRNLLLAVRKVVDAVPDAAFFFKGAMDEQAQKMAASLDVADHCVFIPPEDSETFLFALGIADAILFVPQGNARYIHPQVYTLLHAPAPLVAIHDSAYDEILTERTSIRVLPSSGTIAAGVLRAIQEPLFSLAVASEGQQSIATRHTYSSFKHKVRMAYRKLFSAQE